MLRVAPCRKVAFARLGPAVLVPAALVLAGCGASAPAEPPSERDPAVVAALDDPLASDPDLAGPGGHDTVLAGGGPARAEIPLDLTGPEEAARAREAARTLLGGAIPAAPAPVRQTERSRLAEPATPQAVAEAAGLGPPHCPARLADGFIWAARLPESVPIYPRGHARIAAGSDADGCRMRVVRFVSAGSVQDLVDFYHAAARRAGLSAEHRREGEYAVVVGRRGASGFAAFVRSGEPGLSEVELVTSGL